jgi:hypothetical protein
LAAGPATAQNPDAKQAPAMLEVSPPSPDGSDAPSSSGSDLYSAVWAGRYLDEAPAQKLARTFQARGLTAFTLKKRLTERRFLGDEPVGDFYLVLAGLFGRAEEAEILGRRLTAEGRLRDFRVLPVEAPAELASIEAQNRSLSLRAARTSGEARGRDAAPLSPNSPAETGAGFKNYVQGRLVGSFRDPWRAQAEAERLTASGWPASVRKDPGGAPWYRVYLAPTQDRRDWKADESTLAAAQSAAASQPGLVILADMSSLAGRVDNITPNAERTDASACAGFSEAGRLGAVLNRTIFYIPDASYTVALAPIFPKEQSLLNWREIPGRIKGWWNDEKTRPVKTPLYGPAVYNRPDLERAVSKLTSSPDQASLAVGLTEVSRELSDIPGRKVFLVLSEFQGPDQPQDVMNAMDQLQSSLSGLEPVFVYGDTDEAGYALARGLAREYGSGQAWDGCLLLTDNAYFEKYIKSLFK